MLSKEKKRQRALKRAMEALDIDENDVAINLNLQEDEIEIALQAESVISYFKYTNQFIQKECDWCGSIFAYSLHFQGVSKCSNECRRRYLESIGIQWTPNKPPGERWNKHVPAVVPPEALSLVQSLVPSTYIEVSLNEHTYPLSEDEPQEDLLQEILNELD